MYHCPKFIVFIIYLRINQEELLFVQYLGHLLHYIKGRISNIVDSQHVVLYTAHEAGTPGNIVKSR